MTRTLALVLSLLLASSLALGQAAPKSARFENLIDGKQVRVELVVPTGRFSPTEITVSRGVRPEHFTYSGGSSEDHQGYLKFSNGGKITVDRNIELITSTDRVAGLLPMAQKSSNGLSTTQSPSHARRAPVQSSSLATN